MLNFPTEKNNFQGITNRDISINSSDEIWGFLIQVHFYNAFFYKTAIEFNFVDSRLKYYTA